MKEFIEKFAEALEIEDVTSLDDSTDFRELDEWSSMAVLSLVTMLEDEYGVEISSMDIRKASTLGDLYNFVKNKA